MDGTPNAATFGSSDPNTVAYGNNPDPNTPMKSAVSPMVQQLQSFGRNGDSQLVHMTPGEVGGLQALAKAHGGSLTINPHTGLPEANFLSKILPTVLGAILAPFTGGLSAALLVGTGATIASGGDLKKGLMAGLGAFGGASLGSALGASFGASGAGAAGAATLPGSTVATSLAPAATAGGIAAPAAMLPSAATTGAVAGSQISQAAQAAGAAMQAPSFIPASAVNAATTATGLPTSTLAGLASPSATGALASAVNPAANAAEIALRTGAPTANAGIKAGLNLHNPMISKMLGPDLGAKVGTFGDKFSNAAGANLSNTATSPTMMKTGLAALGVANPILDAMAPTDSFEMPKEPKWNYQGPYKPQDRKVRFPTDRPSGGPEFSYFEDSNPYPGYLTSTGATPAGFAEGGSTGPVFSQTTGAIEGGYMPQAMPQVMDDRNASALQARAADSIFAPSQVQTFGGPMSGIQQAQQMIDPSRFMRDISGRGGNQGPMGGGGGRPDTGYTGGRFVSEAQQIADREAKAKADAEKAKGTTTTGTTTTTPTTTRPVTRPVIQTPKGGGRPDSGNDVLGYDGNNTEAVGDVTDGYYTGIGQGTDFTNRNDGTSGDYNYVDETGMTYDGGNVIGEPSPTAGGDGTAWVDPNIDFTQWDPNVDYTGGVDLSGLDFSNIGGSGGSYGGNAGVDAGQQFVDNMDLSNLGSYDPEQFKADIAAGNYGGSDINGNAYNPGSYDFGGLTDDARVANDYGMGPDTLMQSDYGNFQPAAATDYGNFQPTNTFDYGNFAPADFGGAGANTGTDVYSPSDYYGMDTSGGFEGIGNDYGFDQGSFGLFAKGGQVPLEDGAFIVDARTVSELGNGSSRAGQDLLAKYGGKTLHGPGDGVSDSIRANIGGMQAARVARDEVKFSPQAVARIGGGDLHKGTKKLYAMMERAQKARQHAQRGQNTGLQGILNR